MALFIVFVFGGSTFAFAITGFGGGFGSNTDDQNQFQPLQSNVVDEEIDFQTESVYIQSQFTFLRYYYSDLDDTYSYVAQLPQILTLPTGQPQLIVNRIQGDEQRAEIVNALGTIDIENLSQEGIFTSLCEQLIFTPTDCLLAGVDGGDTLNVPAEQPPAPADSMGGHMG